MNFEEYEDRVRTDPIMVELRKAEAKFQAQWAEERTGRQNKIKELRAQNKKLEAERFKIYRQMQAVVGQIEALLKQQIPKPLNLRTCEKGIRARQRALKVILIRRLVRNSAEAVAKALRTRPVQQIQPPQNETTTRPEGSEAQTEERAGESPVLEREPDVRGEALSSDEQPV